MATHPIRSDVPSPLVRTAFALTSFLNAGEAITGRLLRQLFTSATGRSDASGRWTMRQAYDALELALAMHASASAQLFDGDHDRIIARLERLSAALPAQSHRSEDQIALQQFSTPLILGFAAAIASGATSTDLLLEPSAGNGLLLAPIVRTGCSMLVNEIDPRRREGLAAAFPAALCSGHDAELIDDLLEAGLRPDLVLMNPPFARSLGRGRDPDAAARHLSSAFRRLKDNGRLVAIMPIGFDLPSWAERRSEPMTVQLNAPLPAGLFARHGTGIPTRMVVVDKMHSSAGGDRPCRVEAIGDLLVLVTALPRRKQTSRSCPAPSLPPRVVSLFGGALQASPPRAPVRAVADEEPAPAPLEVEALDDPAPLGHPVGCYLPWRASRLRIEGAQPHPTPLVESLAMGSIAAPRPVYRPVLPSRLVKEGLVSEAQLETLVYAGAAHATDLPGTFLSDDEGCTLKPDGAGRRYRKGFFLGDGTGAGKGRQIAGVILDQWMRGNRRHVWISRNETLLEDARRDWSALGGLPLDIQPLSSWKLGAPVLLDRGILFVTYPTLRSGREDSTRLAQIIRWAGQDFEGVIAFDEAHAMANASGGEGSRGRVKGSEQGLAGLRLQNLLPRARVLYASATGASDIANLSYASRLGLWGPETAFADRDAFIAAIRSGGIAAMELVARDLKALGLYTARALSFAGVEYELLEHALTPDQVEIYDRYADAWSIIHRNLEAALEATRVVDAENGQTLNASAKGAALSRFEGTKQRFFAQLLLSMKLPKLLPAIDDDLQQGHAVVIQLVSTAEAMLDRRLADMDPVERELLEIDLSPREYVIDYLLNAFPTRQMRVFTDEEGNTRSEPMSDADGRPVLCRAAIAARDVLVEELCALPPIGTALDMITERFGTERVAEVTGRTRRLVTKDGAQSIERRSARSNLVEANAFMDGTKRLLVFSDAGGTGRSYHACLKAGNQARRIHYLLEPGWRADAAIQGLGRTHRSAQACAPLFRPVTTDVRGERRFISTIARRLDALGALTRGQRQTGGQNLFDPADNLESDYAKDALRRWYGLLFGGKTQSIGLDAFQHRSGLRLVTEDGGLREDLPPIQRWLNRILALPIALQNAIFDEFMGLVEARVAAAREAGTLDLGLESLAVDSFVIREDRVIRTDPNSGATTHLLKLDLCRRSRPMLLEQVLRFADRPGAAMVQNGRSGRVALRLRARSLLSDDGTSIGRYELMRPARREYLSQNLYEESNWDTVHAELFRTAWQAEAEELHATMHSETLYLATGLLLPIWNKLPDDDCQVLRVVDPSGASVLGRAVPMAAISELSRKLGLDIEVTITPSELVALAERSAKPQPLPGTDMSLKRALVGGAQRLELAGWEPRRLPEYKALGCFTDIIRYQTRLFLPPDRAAEILTHLIG
jgi:predicted RNA methylase